ncbi:hypothetical protein VR010_10240 [Actinomycetaceae bacterium L2_0104]
MMNEAANTATESRNGTPASATSATPERGGRRLLTRGSVAGAVVLAAGLALSGCGDSTSSSPSGSPSVVVSQTPTPSLPVGQVVAPEGTPEIDGFDLIFATQYPGTTDGAAVNGEGSGTGSGSETLGVDGVFTADNAVVAYRNDPNELKYQITGYEIATGEQDWSRAGDGWIECHEDSLIVCETLSYSQGIWSRENPSVLDVVGGGFRSLDVGELGTFVFVGSHDAVAYFLTWDGTRSIHMTGFDDSGAPVVDKNLKLDVPSENAVADIETWMSGGMAWVGVPGEDPGVYAAATNLYGSAEVTPPCISASDGALCTGLNAPTTVVAIDDRGKESWRRATDGEILGSGTTQATLSDIEKVFLQPSPTISHVPDPGIVPGPGDPTKPATAGSKDQDALSPSGAGEPVSKAAAKTALKGSTDDADDSVKVDEVYLVSAGEEIAFAYQRGSTLRLPDRGSLELEQSNVESIDLSHAVSIVNVSQVSDSAGETGAARVFSSILVDDEGNVLSQLSPDQAAELLDGGEPGEQIAAHSLAWQGSNLVFSDGKSGLVAVYRQK